MKLPTEKITINFKEAIKQLTKIFREYSANDIAFSLLISSIWLPNIASEVKHQLLYAIFLSKSIEQYSRTDKIKTYSDFKQFLDVIIPLLPDFPFLEDYVAETDWGEVKFHHRERNYSIFYGTEIENVYDYLMLFQVLYSSLDREYTRLEARSPSEELLDRVFLQNEIITGITTQPKGEKLKINPGDFRIPNKKFWKQSIEFFYNFPLSDRLSVNYLEKFTISPGTRSIEGYDFKKFCTSVYNGTLLPYSLLKVTDRVIPLLPRRLTSVLIERWAEVYHKHENILNVNDAYTKHISAEVYKFLKKRVRSTSIFPFVAALTKEGTPDDTVYSSSLVSNGKLILVYTPAPFSSSKEMGKRLSKVIPKLKQSLAIIESTPITLGLLAENKLVSFQSDNSGETLKPVLFIVLSETTTKIQEIPLDEDPPGRILSLDQFLGLFDEIDDISECDQFLEYLEEVEPKMIGLPVSLLDKYGSFKDSYGTIINGAIDPNMLLLYPHWGSHQRYITLSNFWKQFPEEGYYNHPRSWRIEAFPDGNSRLIARGFFGSAIYCKLKNCHLFTTAPFENMTYHQVLTSNLLMEIIEDTFQRNKSLIEKLIVFEHFNRVQINFFPWLMVKENQDLRHLRHLNPLGNKWKSDVGWPKYDVPGVRVVYDEDLLSNVLESSNDCSVEIELMIEVLEHLNRFAQDPDFDGIVQNLEKQKANKPRFKLRKIQKEVAFPEFVSPYIPSIHYIKEASKTVAKLCMDLGIVPGKYKLRATKLRLNQLRKRLLEKIDLEVSKYDFKLAMPYLIERIDALIFENDRDILELEYSLEHEVDYQRDVRYADKDREFSRNHSAFRYLIEKFIQLEPKGMSRINKEGFQYLITLCEKLLEIYYDSDIIFYGMYQAGMTVNNDYLMKVGYTVDIEAMEQSYSREEANIQLGIMGNKDDRVTSFSNVEDVLDKIDGAFYKDMGFGYINLMKVLGLLSIWPTYADSMKERSWYTASDNQIVQICINNIDNIDRNEILKIVDFLTLKKSDVTKLLGGQNLEDEIPVWSLLQ